MIFKKSLEKTLNDELFANPTNEYRGAPFWSWNNLLEDEKLKRDIDCFEEMGIGGFHMHSRTGLNTEYMSEDFLARVKTCVDYAKSKNMKAYLYDEDRWPSGAAGGIVTKDHQYRSRYLFLSPFSKDQIENETNHDSRSSGFGSSDGKLLAKYNIELENGFLKSYKMLSDDETGDNVWYAYMDIAKDSPWFNNQAYIDTLNPKAIERFIEETHEKYYEVLKDDIGDTVPAIFTDEPQFTRKNNLGFAQSKEILVMPYTDDFEELYKKEYNQSCLEHLPEIFWELPDNKISVTRYNYHDFVAELFARSFADTIGKWCDEHDLPLTGHMMEEPTLESQTAALGDAMRSYRSFGLPGIDMLCDAREYSTAKQAQSATHQFGYEGVLSELYGVTGWDYDFRRHKLQGDWQAALGVTNRVHHLSWYSMEGEAKRDYPASIFHQSPWYKEYKLIEDHFARVCTAMTRGKPKVNIGVIHPVESFWLHFGPLEQTKIIRDEMETNFENIIKWLLFNHLDFDFIAESLLPIQNNSQDDNLFTVGEMKYETVIVPECETIRRSTFERLVKFANAGGKVIFMGRVPKYIDAVESDECIEFAKKCTNIPFVNTVLRESLEDNRFIDIRYANGSIADDLIYQLREDTDCEWLFIVNGKLRKTYDLSYGRTITIKIKGTYSAKLYDTLSGEISDIKVNCKNGFTSITKQYYEHDSILLKLEKSENIISSENTCENVEYETVLSLLDVYDYKLSEDNALLLDKAEYKFNDEEWQAKEDLLLIDDIYREKLSFPGRKKSVEQPWVIAEETKIDNKLSLRFTVNSLIEVENVYFALERPNLCDIYVNDQKIDKTPCGYYVDDCIQKVFIGKLSKGTTQITVIMPFGKKTNVEWCYILGDFGVRLMGENITIVEKFEKLPFGDYSQYNLPFYTGNITYKCNFNVDEAGEYAVKINKFRSPLISVEIDGKDAGRIAFAPYVADIGELEKGEHTLKITLFGHRFNGFGALHNCNELVSWHGPDAWRSVGESYSKFYFLKKMGALKEPIVLKKK